MDSETTARRAGAPLPPEQWALRELERIEQKLMPPQGDAEVFHTQLSHVVRRYLAERFGLHALAADHGGISRSRPPTAAGVGGAASAVARFFERCDLAKFARASTPPEECRRTAEMARELVRQTTNSPTA